MFFILPLSGSLSVYLIAALLPAVLLLFYIYRQDRVEKEPLGLLLSLLALGAGAALLSVLPEAVGEGILAALVRTDSPDYKILLAFLVVAVVEESAKYIMLRLRTWKDPNFNYRFDAIVYAVFVSLGFAALENVRYVMSYGISVALPRALLSIPGHMGFAVFMGLFYGRARLFADLGRGRAARRSLWGGWLAAVLLHGTYDACAMLGTTAATTVFVVFIAALYLTVFCLVRVESRKDSPV